MLGDMKLREKIICSRRTEPLPFIHLLYVVLYNFLYLRDCRDCRVLWWGWCSILHGGQSTSFSRWNCRISPLWLEIKKQPLRVVQRSCHKRWSASCITWLLRRRFGLVGNVVGRINEVNQRRARLVLGWVTVFKTCKPSLYVISHPGQLSLAILPRVGKMSTGDDYGHRQGRNGEFCVTVGPVTRTADILT